MDSTPPPQYVSFIMSSIPPHQYASFIISSIPPPQYTSSITESTPPPRYISSITESTPPPQYASPTEDSVPRTEYSVDTIPPLYYAFESVCGISPEVDEWIRGTAPEPYLHSCEKISHLANTANIHKSKLMRLAMTRLALRLVLGSHERDWRDPKSLRILGLRSLPGAIVHDIIKPPCYLARMAIAISQSKHERRRVENEIEDELLESLSVSLDVVVEILVRLGLETPETLKRQMQSRGWYMFLALARFLEAYGSRFAPPGTVYLASRKRLPREHCSGLARLHFDQIHDLKDDLIFLPDTSAAIEQWLPRALRALKGLSVDRDENYLFDYVLQRLCQTRDELPGLVLPASRN